MPERIQRVLAGVGLGGYLIAFHQVALTSPGGADGVPEPGSNLVPFAAIVSSISSPTPAGHLAYYFVGNLLMLAPFVVLAGLTWPKLSPRILVAMAFAASLAVEAIQMAFIPGRAGDVDDVILNTFGAVCGVIALAWFRRILSDRIGREAGLGCNSTKSSSATSKTEHRLAS